MKKAIKYIVLAAVEVAFAFIYGFFLQEHIPFLGFLIWAVSVPFLALMIHAFVSKKILGHEIVIILIVSVLFGVLAAGTFEVGNKIYGEYIGEYVVVVTDIRGYHNEEATVRLPNGESASIDIDSKLMYFDESEYVDEGDMILVQEYKGLFGNSFYVFVEEIEDN